MAFLKLAFLLSCALFLSASACKNDDKKATPEEICEAVLGSILNTVEDESAKKIDSYIKDHFCAKWPFGSHLCEDEVDKAVKAVTSMINVEANPKKICSHFFNNNFELDINELFEAEATNGLIECASCKIVSDAALNYLKLEHVQKSMVHFGMEHICPIFVKNVEDCEGILGLSYDFLNETAYKLKSELLCEKIHACSKPKKEVMVEQVEDIEFTVDAVVPSTNGFFECEACTEAVRLAKSFVRPGMAEEKIIKVLDKVCDTPLLKYIPGFKRVCHKLVDEKLKHIADLLIGHIEPEYICKAIDAC